MAQRLLYCLPSFTEGKGAFDEEQRRSLETV